MFSKCTVALYKNLATAEFTTVLYMIYISAEFNA